MTTISLNILQKDNEDLVINILKALQKNEIINFIVSPPSLTLKGKSLSFDELNLHIEEAEKSTPINFEDAMKMMVK